MSALSTPAVSDGGLAVSLSGTGRAGRVLRVSALCASPVAPPPFPRDVPMSQNSCTDLSYIRLSCSYAHQCCSSLSWVLTPTPLCDIGGGQGYTVHRRQHVFVLSFGPVYDPLSRVFFGFSAALRLFQRLGGFPSIWCVRPFPVCVSLSSDSLTSSSGQWRCVPEHRSPLS
jgi:hypothetical protein